MRGCSALPVDAGVATILRTVDCHATAAVVDGYARLFGASGAFGEVLTAALTIYIALLAYLLLTGRAGLSLATLTPRMLALGLVLTFATSWPAYQTVVFDLLTRGPEQVASVVLGTTPQVTQGFAGHLDQVFARLMEAANHASAAGANAVQAGRPPVAPGELLKYSALILLLGTVGALVMVKIVLATLLAVGPLFIVMALFGGTRGLFEGWLRTTVLFAITPMLIVLTGAAAVTMLNPLIAALADQGGTISLREAVTLFVGSIVYAALLLLAFRAAVGMTSAWRLPVTLYKTAARADSASGTPAPTGHNTPQTVVGPAAGQQSADRSDRVGSLVAAVSHGPSEASAPRAAAVVSVLSGGQPTAAGSAASPRSSQGSRAQGLGQTFRGRSQPARHSLSGAIGS